jgi:hypothetical protein
MNRVWRFLETKCCGDYLALVRSIMRIEKLHAIKEAESRISEAGEAGSTKGGNNKCIHFSSKLSYKDMTWKTLVWIGGKKY